ncbi:MAG: vWA domain-containing protein [Candidatus Limnocylindrales bacterium]
MSRTAMPRVGPTPGRPHLTTLVVLLAIALVAVACDPGEAEPLEPAEAGQRLTELASDIGWLDEPIDRRASVEPGGGKALADTLPDISEFPLVVRPDATADRTVAEIFVSTEKSGSGIDGWMVEAAESFNDSGQRLADGREAQVAIRSIASGTAYQFIAAGEGIPAGFSPSNHLWVEMAGTHSPLSVVTDQTVPNVAGIVMKEETAEELRERYGELGTKVLLEAVINGDLVMGYTDPFASSTGLNFLLTVLDDFAEGDEDRLVDPDVASVFETFQEQVPFVAFTTLQLRESVERDNGSLDAFVMEWQTYVNTDSLRDGFEFIPFGIRHDNPLYAFDAASPAEREVLELFGEHLRGEAEQRRAAELGFDPPDYTSDVSIPSGTTLIEAQQLWKDKKDAGRPVYAVFVTDTSGSMAGSRIAAVQRALESSREFINPEASVGMVEFADRARRRLEIAPFDLNQQAQFAAAVQDMDPVGGTAMYDGVILGLSMLAEQREQEPGGKYMLIVLTDGETNEGLRFGDVDEVVAGLRIPVVTVGFEANLEELGRLASLVEAATINASEGDVEFKLSSLFNAGV